MMNFTRSMADLFTFMARRSTAATRVLYLTCAAASLRLTATGEMPRSVPFLIVAGLGLVSALWTFYGAGLAATGWIFVLLALGTPIYFLTPRPAPAAEAADSPAVGATHPLGIIAPSHRPAPPAGSSCPP